MDLCCPTNAKERAGDPHSLNCMPMSSPACGVQMQRRTPRHTPELVFRLWRFVEADLRATVQGIASNSDRNPLMQDHAGHRVDVSAACKVSAGRPCDYIAITGCSQAKMCPDFAAEFPPFDGTKEHQGTPLEESQSRQSTPSFDGQWLLGAIDWRRELLSFARSFWDCRCQPPPGRFLAILTRGRHLDYILDSHRMLQAPESDADRSDCRY